jgi:N-acetylmannosamine-6-phosphate 2-epimerase/N-acetylmannosamine kinase
VFSEDLRLLRSERIPLPPEREDREDWIRHQIETNQVARLGVSSGGTIDPITGVVIEAKPIIPNHEGARLSIREFGIPTIALNDGLATAWGHACHPRFAGKRVATLALGTGVGCGFVADHRLWMGPHGEYPRLNDLSPLADQSFEDLLGGASLTADPSNSQKDAARYAAVRAIRTLQALYMPEVIVLCGGVGLSEWLELGDFETVVLSPYGADAGLFGAATLALYRPA